MPKKEPPKKESAKKEPAKNEASGRESRRSFPHHTLEESLPLAQKIADEMGGRPMNRLLLADAVGIKPSSSNFRDQLSSAFKYGLTDGTEKAEAIGLTAAGIAATQGTDPDARLTALRQAALKPKPFGSFFEDYKNKKLPSGDMLPKILTTQYSVPKDIANECATLLSTNARFAGLLRDIGGSLHVLLDSRPGAAAAARPKAEGTPAEDEQDHADENPADDITSPVPKKTPAGPGPSKPIFVGHGKNVIPLQKLENLLTTFKIPHKATVREANLGRPIPQKVKETMIECGSAILIFTKDEKFLSATGEELWRPSENVVHELGAASFAYDDRIVIFKEKGLHFPTNYQSIGYIEFEVDSLEAKTADLLKELIGFGLVKVLPA